jgi:hypothetical protein
VLRLSERDVFTFYSAVAALGLVVSASRPAEATDGCQPAAMNRRRGVLRRIFDKLHHG